MWLFWNDFVICCTVGRTVMQYKIIISHFIVHHFLVSYNKPLSDVLRLYTGLPRTQRIGWWRPGAPRHHIQSLVAVGVLSRASFTAGGWIMSTYLCPKETGNVTLPMLSGSSGIMRFRSFPLGYWVSRQVCSIILWITVYNDKHNIYIGIIRYLYWHYLVCSFSSHGEMLSCIKPSFLPSVDMTFTFLSGYY